ncbi:MAG: hypothetical protein QW270_02575 [Candidatus Bathyarchaeia archaeon]
MNPAFLQGTVMRTNALIESQKPAEAQHYLEGIMLNILQNYALLKASTEKTKISQTTLMRSLERLEAQNPKNYNNMINFLNLNDVDKLSTAKTIDKVREITLKIRKNRKTLIKSYVK